MIYVIYGIGFVGAIIVGTIVISANRMDKKEHQQKHQ